MKTFFSDLLPKIKRFGAKLDDLTLLTNQHWVLIDEIENSKCVYIFRSNAELLISRNGRIEKGKWEYLGNGAIIIDLKTESYLFRHGFFDDTILALKIDGKNEYVFLVNENKFELDLNSSEKVLSLLEHKYLDLIEAASKKKPDIKEGLKGMDTEAKDSFSPYLTELVLDQELNPIQNKDLKYGYLDRNGQEVIPFRYSRAYDFKNGVALVVTTVDDNDLYNFIDRRGNLISEVSFEYAESFSHGVALVRLNRKFGFIDQTGQAVIEFMYDDAESFDNNRALVKSGSSAFYIDPTGRKLFVGD